MQTYDEDEDDSPYCDAGCGQRATVQTAECGYCDDCFAESCRDTSLVDLMGYEPCCNVWRQNNGFLVICLAPRGVEHDHSS